MTSEIFSTSNITNLGQPSIEVALNWFSEPEKLRKLLVYLQDETIAIEKPIGAPKEHTTVKE